MNRTVEVMNSLVINQFLCRVLKENNFVSVNFKQNHFVSVNFQFSQCRVWPAEGCGLLPRTEEEAEALVLADEGEGWQVVDLIEVTSSLLLAESYYFKMTLNPERLV